MEQSHQYSVELQWIGDKKGTLRSEGLPEMTVATPPEFPGGHEGVWAPEHLFVGSITSCIMNTFLAIAENSRIELSSYDASGTGTLEQSGRSYVFTKVDVEVRVAVPDEKTAGKIERLVQKAEQNCFISQSVKAEVAVTSSVTVA
jgi:peroxiredoxin-like protein